MSAITQIPLLPVQSASEPNLVFDVGSDRRADLDAKQARVFGLLQEAGCEGLLVLEPENFAWLSSGAIPRSNIDAGELPALYFGPEQRWLLASNADSQRLFDEELDGLGFQLKEWPWHWGRAQLLADLCADRKLATDRPLGEARVVAERLGQMRRYFSPYEQACFQALGQIVSHALEATCRTMRLDDTERDLAGQLGHRLLHRGAFPLAIGVAADDRSRLYRQFGFTSTPVKKHAVLTATARKYGLCVTASRSMSFGAPVDDFRKEHDAACKVTATYIASTWPDAVPREVLATGRRVYQLTGYEHEWLLAPQGFITGRAAVETPFTPRTDELLHSSWGVTWRASVGAGLSCDTFLIGDKGPILVTPTETWPLKRIRVQGADFFRPDILVR